MTCRRTQLVVCVNSINSCVCHEKWKCSRILKRPEDIASRTSVEQAHTALSHCYSCDARRQLLSVFYYNQAAGIFERSLVYVEAGRTAFEK